MRHLLSLLIPLLSLTACQSTSAPASSTSRQHQAFMCHGYIGDTINPRARAEPRNYAGWNKHKFTKRLPLSAALIVDPAPSDTETHIFAFLYGPNPSADAKGRLIFNQPAGNRKHLRVVGKGVRAIVTPISTRSLLPGHYVIAWRMQADENAEQQDLALVDFDLTP